MSSPDEDLNKQINHKFIRPTYKPFQGTPMGLQKKIKIDPNGLPTYKIEKTNLPKETMHGPPEISNLTMDKKMQTTPVPSLNYTPQDILPQVPMEVKPNEKLLLSPPPDLPKPKPTAPYHNCCDLYHQVQSCPVCKSVYTKNDGIYITVIVILLVVILFLLKKIFI